MSVPNVRTTERLSASFPVIVKCKDSNENFWKERTQTISVSRNGAGFILQHECHIGQLLSLILTFPKDMRCYDREKELYRIWGLVQHCSLIETEETSGYHVGVALVGKDAPVSYKENPAQSYKISGMGEDGLWSITEASKPFVRRKNPRFWVSLEVQLEIPDAKNKDLSRETTTTENISVCGAAIYSNLNLKLDDRVKVEVEEFDFSGLADVRHIQTDGDGNSKIHVEFVEANFPIEKIVSPIEDET